MGTIAAIRPFKLAAKSRQRLQGLKATYARGNDSVAIKIVPGRSWREVTRGEFPVRVEQRDCLIIADELKLGGALVKPERHDTITIEIAGVSQTLEVAPLDLNAEPWEPVDVYGIEIRVHVQLI